MRVDRRIIEKLDLSAAAADIVLKQLDHFPPLALTTCLKDGTATLVQSVAAAFGADRYVSTETLTMPRKGFGPRPIVVVEPSALTLYQALVVHLDHALAPPTRVANGWDEHRKFGLDGASDYVVEADIAACYEYVDHQRLLDELLLRSSNLPHSEAVVGLLGEIMQAPRGLPQMLGVSDRLADTYLSILERQLLRDGHQVSRYVDDFRILADTWESANSTIEQMAEYARALGLVLSTDKTRVYKRSTLIGQQREDAEFVDNHFQEARATLTHTVWSFSEPYGGVEEEQVEPEDQEAMQAAVWEIFEQWHSLVNTEGPSAEVPRPMQGYLPHGFAWLYGHPRRLSDDLLRDIVFQQPQRIEQVCRYLVVRAIVTSDEPHWGALNVLTKMGRQSPWAKLWLMFVVEVLPDDQSEARASVLDWTRRQLDDRHEVVRSQAAWVCSKVGVLPTDCLSRIYRDASRLTQPAIAAAAAKQAGVSQSVRGAIVGDSPLNQEAAKWATLKP